MGYNTKVYRKQGGDELVVADGGKIIVKSGGAIEPEEQVTIDDLDAESAELADVIDTVNDILAVLRTMGIVAPSDDNGGNDE